jgi:hypothetical protein
MVAYSMLHFARKIVSGETIQPSGRGACGAETFPFALARMPKMIQ